MSQKTERYELLIQQAKGLLTGEFDLVANMSNLASLIFSELPDLNGTSFYRYQNDELILGPFQGKPACMHIAVGAGVCGTVAETKQSEIVPDVHQFKGISLVIAPRIQRLSCRFFKTVNSLAFLIWIVRSLIPLMR